MNLAQSGIIPLPSSRFAPYLYKRPELVPANSHQEKVLLLLHRYRDCMAFGSAQYGFSFSELKAEIGEHSTLGSTLARLKGKGYIVCEVYNGKARYRITELGACAL